MTQPQLLFLLRNKVDIREIRLVVGQGFKSVIKELAVALEYAVLLCDHNKVDRRRALCVVLRLGIRQRVDHAVDAHKVLI